MPHHDRRAQILILHVALTFSGLMAVTASDPWPKTDIEALLHKLQMSGSKDDKEAKAELDKRGAAAVPDLLTILEDKYALVNRDLMFRALGYLGKRAKSAVPVLISELRNHSSSDLDVVAITLDQIGTKKAESFLRQFEAEEFQRYTSTSAAVSIGTFGRQGFTSRIESREIDRVTTGDDWKSLWRKHSGSDLSRPKIDFSKDMVLAIFAGRNLGLRGFALTGIERRNGEMIVMQTLFYSDGLREPGDTQFIMFSIPRFTGRIRFVERYSMAMAFDRKTWKPIGQQEKEDKVFDPL